MGRLEALAWEISEASQPELFQKAKEEFRFGFYAATLATLNADRQARIEQVR